MNNDLISRSALKLNIDKFIGYLDEDMIYRIKVVIDNAPTVEERPTGEWIALYENDGTPKGYKCPYCDDEPQIINTNFCPNCGADLKGGAE